MTDIPPLDAFPAVVPQKGQPDPVFDAAYGDLLAWYRKNSEQMPPLLEWMEATRDEVLATALVGDLPDATGHQGKVLTANGGGAAGFARSETRATCTNNANVYLLDTSLGLTTTADGMSFRFRAPAANTGSVAFRIDGQPTQLGRTVTGATLPVGYLRTAADTVITRVGGEWIVSREPELIPSATNGRALRLANGYQVCWHGAALGTILFGGNGTFATPYRSDRINWTFPAPFSVPPIGEVSSYAPTAETVDEQLHFGSFRTTSVTQMTSILSVQIGSTSPYRFSSVHLTARGVWYGS